MVSFTLRLPDGLHARLKVDAARNFRSLHAEVLSRLGSDVPARPVAFQDARFPPVSADAQPRDIPARTVTPVQGMPSGKKTFKPDFKK